MNGDISHWLQDDFVQLDPPAATCSKFVICILDDYALPVDALEGLREVGQLDRTEFSIY
jgi:hypothetical protein